MSNFSESKNLAVSLQNLLANKLINLQDQFGELTIMVRAEDILTVCKILRDDPVLSFDTLIDICGIDYSTYGDHLTTKNLLQDKRCAAT